MAATDPGPRDHLITRALERDLSALDAEVVDEQPLDPAEAPDRLARHAMGELRVALDGEDSADAQAARVNALLCGFDQPDQVDREVALPARVLQGIKGRSPLGDVVPLPPLPATPFSQSDLLVNAEGQPNVGSELRHVIVSVIGAYGLDASHRRVLQLRWSTVIARSTVTPPRR